MVHGVFIRAPACSSPTNPLCVFVCTNIHVCVHVCVFLVPKQTKPQATVGRVQPLAGNEPRYLFFFRSTASARCFPTWRTAFPRLEPAQGLTIVMSSRSALFLCRGWLSKSAPASVVMSIRNGFSLPFSSLALCRKGHVSSTTNWTLLSRRDRASAWWSTRLWVRELHPVFEQDIAWRRVVSCRQPLP